MHTSWGTRTQSVIDHAAAYCAHHACVFVYPRHTPAHRRLRGGGWRHMMCRLCCTAICTSALFRGWVVVALYVQLTATKKLQPGRRVNARSKGFWWSLDGPSGGGDTVVAMPCRQLEALPCGASSRARVVAGSHALDSDRCRSEVLQWFKLSVMDS